MAPQIRGSGTQPLLGYPNMEPFKVVQITDGTSNTILLCEDAGRPDRYIKGRLISAGTRNDGGIGGGKSALKPQYSNLQSPFTKVTVKRGEANNFTFDVN